MARLGSDLDQRFENKPPLMHGGMGNLQARFIHHTVAEQHQVNVDLARTLLTHTETAHPRFDLQRDQ